MNELLSTDQQFHTCPDCKCQFVQPFVCTTCGAQKLYDETVRSQAAQIEQLRKMLDEAHTALLAFVTTYNGNPTRFQLAERETGEALECAYDKIDAFLYPPRFA